MEVSALAREESSSELNKQGNRLRVRETHLIRKTGNTTQHHAITQQHTNAGVFAFSSTLLHSYSAFLTSGHSRRLTILPNIHPFMHTFTHR